jgi:hypothetical protein
MKNYCFVSYRKEMNLPDGIYNGKYNKEPAIIRIEFSLPTWVQFIGFMKDVDGEETVNRNCIFDAKGILHSSVQLLLPAQELQLLTLNQQP